MPLTIFAPRGVGLLTAGGRQGDQIDSAVVTGAAMGIGLAIAGVLVSAGVAVVALDIDAAALAAARTSLGELYEPVVGDVGSWQAHESAADAAQHAGALRYWVNNAGIDLVGAAHEVDEAHIERGLRVLQLGTMFGTAVAVRRMLPARHGAIVNVSSIHGIVAFPRHFVYDAAKAAVLMVTKSAAVDYGASGLRCNAVLPGAIETPMTYSALPPELPREAALRREGLLAPMQRIGQASEVAEVVWFLLSDRGSFVNGAEVVVDGGAAARCFPYPASGDVGCRPSRSQAHAPRPT